MNPSMSAARATLSLALSCVALACQPASPTTDAAVTDSASLGDATVSGADAGAGESGVPSMCNTPTWDVAPAGAACVRAVEGSVLSDGAQPLERGFVTVCGSACFIGELSSQGRFVVAAGEVVPVPLYSVLVHGRPAHASAYWPMPAPDSDGIVRFASPLSVPRYTATGAELPESRMIASEIRTTVGAVTLVFSAGSTVEYDFEDFELMALGRTVRVAEVAVDRAPPFAREGALVGPVWALAPFALTSSAPVAITVANRANLPANSPVEFVAMGKEIVSASPDAGRAVLVARGTVSADGATVSTDPGQGLRWLTWFGLRSAR